MYRMQLKNWLPWQLGFSRDNPSAGAEVVTLINEYVQSQVEGGSSNTFFLDGVKAATGIRLSHAEPSSSWERINNLQWQMFKETLKHEPAGSGFVQQNMFSRWGSLDRGQQPRYVTAFDPNRDSGDLLGLSCAGDCGKRFAALRVTAFLQRPGTSAAQLKALEDVEAWVATSVPYSPTGISLFLFKNHSRRSEESKQESARDAIGRLKDWNKTAFSKMLDTPGLQHLGKL